MDREPIKFLSTESRFLIAYQDFTSKTINLLLKNGLIFCIFIVIVWDMGKLALKPPLSNEKYTLILKCFA